MDTEKFSVLQRLSLSSFMSDIKAAHNFFLIYAMVGNEKCRSVNWPAMRNLNHPETLIKFIQNLREGIYITNTSGEIIDCNPAFLEMFGVHSLEDLKGYTAGNLVKDPRKRDIELRILEKEGAVREFELEIRRPDGQERIVLDTGYRVLDPVNGEVLYHGILVDITDRKRLEQQLREQAIRDPLTGCYNRHYLAEIVAECRKGMSGWGVIVADVDNFKEFNDRHGHSYGDRILTQLGRFLTQEVRLEDRVFRIGGDEFMVYLPCSNLNETSEIAARFRKKGPTAAPVSFTLGYGVREEHESLEETIRRADQQLIHIRVRERQTQSRRSSQRAIASGQ
jgi:diguanylate cyclase (GGDEF)-like protein/PAS domain S-box-containing protein